MGNAQNITGHPQSQFQLGHNAIVVPQSNNAQLPGMPEIQQPMLPYPTNQAPPYPTNQAPTAPTPENDYELPDEGVQRSATYAYD